MAVVYSTVFNLTAPVIDLLREKGYSLTTYADCLGDAEPYKDDDPFSAVLGPARAVNAARLRRRGHGGHDRAGMLPKNRLARRVAQDSLRARPREAEVRDGDAGLPLPRAFLAALIAAGGVAVLAAGGVIVARATMHRARAHDAQPDTPLPRFSARPKRDLSPAPMPLSPHDATAAPGGSDELHAHVRRRTTTGTEGEGSWTIARKKSGGLAMEHEWQEE
ncbi:hypothetical protein DFJ74DRAFT_690986 [Hyaloraphidium curvatum]|nr:hypothetical protein DFJ74DRAFT_690986 [Hyaloraphidium curvatum]